MFARLGASALGALRGLMVYGLLVGLSSSVSAVEKMTGADVVRVCSQSSGDAASLSACTFFFQGALDALATVQNMGHPFPFCVPQEMRVQDLAALYLSESERYPEVLDEQATDLLLGMLLKFFPCGRA